MSATCSASPVKTLRFASTAAPPSTLTTPSFRSTIFSTHIAYLYHFSLNPILYRSLARRQIRRSSYHDVVRVSEIESAMDIRGVQTYVINSARVLFLNERPQPKNSSHGAASSNPKTMSYLCETCCRTLLDPFRFCSLGCKVEGMRKNKEEEEERLRKERQQETHKGTHPPTHTSNSRRRKGIPHRAPFAS
ncbi:PREDICTED: uncharacterized protein LOC104752687 isoform X1 [Camelina sativa]|uniref:Uncharacterized protein LOC104752687 isoform X1 n=1 Tax=Camelina sativa TaxID=90675 RepID=A0ABM1R4D1_CAMSA|nr:PREDICTED: uncharacterized protein LOC104752687 isoform X1 [Camelina sativa]